MGTNQLIEFLAVWLLLVIRSRVSGEKVITDYCVATKCGKSHIGCNNLLDPHKDCPSFSTKLLDLVKYKDRILYKHNDIRNRVAGGFTDLLPATRMSVMAWDDELARVAEFQAMRCNYTHVECHSLPRFPDSGQNMILFTTNEHIILNDDIIGRLLDYWIDQKSVTNKKVIDKIGGDCPDYSKRIFNAFTLMVQQNNSHVGCGASTYLHRGYEHLFMVCNYANSNKYNEEVYQSGNEPASNCASGTVENFAFLCDEWEYYEQKPPPI